MPRLSRSLPALRGLAGPSSMTLLVACSLQDFEILQGDTLHSAGADGLGSDNGLVSLGGTDVGGSGHGAEGDAEPSGSGGSGSGTWDVDAGADEPEGNLLANPGFESGVAPWNVIAGQGLLSLSSMQPHSGSNCGRVSSRTGSYQGPAYPLTDVLEQGETYRFSAYGRVGNAPSAPMLLSLRVTCNGLSTRYDNVTQTLTAADTSWILLEGAYTVPSAESCELMDLQLYLEGPPTGVDIYIDDVSITRF